MASNLCNKCALFAKSRGLQHTALNNLPFLYQNVLKISPPSAGYAKKAAKGAAKGAKAERLYDILEVNTDPKYLVAHCAGSNYFKEGVDIELKADKEYPDWLWKLSTGKPLELHEMDPETPQYWRKLRKMHMKRNNRLSKGKKF